jgi:hypothetical protein
LPLGVQLGHNGALSLAFRFFLLAEINRRQRNMRFGELRGFFYNDSRLRCA